ncbi:hypothetical protein [Ferribacterium limneticum]|uniref:hypothetical protein n=1 Tax=Ferribacterium limneticum TaxID=76259 RepID=UPI001CF81C49|nr:hypothetical protein [Ferribacterium limneticum]UCV21738.1 hypothetical protein KI613_14485 [Ferribacterium limneticum]
MKFALSIIALIAIALIVPFLVPGLGKQEGVDPNANLPWQIELDAQGGSSVFGLRPGISTVGDVRQKFGSEMDVAIIAEPNEMGTLEGYYSQVALGFVLAKVIVTVDAKKELISEMRDRALRAKHMESSTHKITLNPDDLVAIEKMAVKAISVIPSVNLDEATVIQRFGPPGERLAVSEKRVHLLYPEKGLDVVVDGDGKELLQYVAPRNFAELREPLNKLEGEKSPAQ